MKQVSKFFQMIDSIENLKAVDYSSTGVWVHSPKFDNNMFITSTDIDLLLEVFSKFRKGVDFFRKNEPLFDFSE